MQYKLSASILSANFTKLGQELDDLITAGIDYIHLDIMDNHYVPNLSFGPKICQDLHAAYPQAILDVHIMAKPVETLIDSFIKSGANSISIHPDSTIDIDECILKIKEAGCLANIALNPTTPLDTLQPILNKIDGVLVMSVNPGFGGQQFIQNSIQKITDLKNLLQTSKIEIPIAVDGGINADTIKAAQLAGANIFVIGSALLKTGNYKQTIQEFKNLLL